MTADDQVFQDHENVPFQEIGNRANLNRCSSPPASPIRPRADVPPRRPAVVRQISLPYPAQALDIAEHAVKESLDKT
jgi:hypothetical protein